MTDTARRLTLADAYRDAQHVIDQLTTRTASEPYAQASVETTAKMEPKPDVKVGAPVGCDYEELEAHALRVANIAATAWRAAMDATTNHVAAEEEIPF